MSSMMLATLGAVRSRIEPGPLILSMTARQPYWPCMTPLASTYRTLLMSKSSNPYQQPPIQPSQNRPNVKQGDATGGVIPYKNPMALIGYYLGWLSLLPLIGILFTIPAIILGFIGFSRYQKNPVIKGQFHAWIAIIFGGIGLLGSGFCFLMMILGMIAG